MPIETRDDHSGALFFHQTKDDKEYGNLKKRVVDSERELKEIKKVVLELKEVKNE